MHSRVCPEIANDFGIDSSSGRRKPNFFIIGSMKSGTTSLWRLLASHPSIFMCGAKEPSYSSFDLHVRR
jgi:hypothetical protein